MPSTIWCPLTLLLSIAFSQTTPLTTPDGCSANYAYVFIESTLHTLSKTITSERVNYPPYSYTPSVPRRKLVPFALNDPITDTSNNPCDTSTWTIPSISYDNSIILLTYSDHFATICTPQQWTLNLQTYNTNIQALLIANDKDITNVYPLPGDNTLTNPIIPTRMISQSSAKNIKYILNNTNEDIYVSIDCFNNTSPALICIVDQSSIGNTVELDGEFQKQGDIFVNSHPVWLKEGMNGIWDDYYIWLTIDHSYGADAYSWKWVIGTDYNDDSTIYAECLAPWSDHMTDPTQCSGNWYKNQKLLPELVSRNGVCDLGDNYVCVDSGSEMFDTYFGGRYRQVHDNTAIWFGDNTQFDSYLSIQYVNMSFASGWSFVFSFAANGGVHAFCVIQEGESFASYTIGHDSGNMALSPWNCNKNWYVVIYDAASQGYKWFNDPLMDIDQCNHPSVSTQTPKQIIYPKYMCFTDAVNKYSPYQTYFGIWTLDNSSSNQYDNRHVYQNQRLSGLTQGEWYMMWYDEKDSWIIKEEIPELTYSETYGGICRDNVDTPDQCTSCWEFYQGVHNEYNCDAKVSPILTNNEADCMVQPIDNIINYQDDITLCFGTIHKYTGKWQLETRYEHDGRKIWYLSNELTGDRDYYIYYDNIWRFWIIHSRFTDIEEEWDLRCLLWDEYEPFNCKEWYTVDNRIISMSTDCTLSPTIAPTPHPTIECIEYNKYVYVESPGFTNQVLESKEVNFPPYKSHTFHRANLVLFEPLTDTTGNPCDYNTWTYLSSYYDNKVVLIKWSTFYESLCSVQQWTLQLEEYANVVGVLIGNDKDFNHVYSLSGDDNLAGPTIPTRMIGQMATILLEYTLNGLDPIWITFGCFDLVEEYPNTICLVDTTKMGNHVYLDGEYQRQTIEINNHPIWLKQGHIGLWGNIYMFLDVDRNIAGESSWKWVIGTDYNDRNAIIAECDLNGEHVSNPAECDLDWSINGVLISNISTADNQCSLGDNYVCVESMSGGFFEYYFAGRYRQIHSGVPLWFLESDTLDAHIQIRKIDWPVIFDNTQYVFAFMVNQSDLYAFCIIGEEYPSKDVALSPYKCNKDWYVIDYDYEDTKYKWIIDMAFDIDECTHPSITTIAPIINYPQQLCLSDSTHSYSHYQGHYGIYLLDTTQEFDGRYVYRNQRLSNSNNEWYMLWYEEKDSWVINEMIPGETIIRNTNGICRENVLTPDECINSCWEFYKGYEMELMCNVKTTIINSNIESDCMGPLPINNIIHYTKEINLCFDDGVTSDWNNPYSGKWYLEENKTFGGRAYWYKIDAILSLPGIPVIQYYIFYDEYWRFWVMDRILGNNNADQNWNYLHYYCLYWDEFEPFNCDTWYSSMSHMSLPELSMTRDCVSSPPSIAPTLAPTIHCDARNAWIFAETDHYVYSDETVMSIETNYPPLMYDTFNKRELVLFENGRIMDKDNSNPCDINTWIEYPIYYENKVVLIKYDDYISTLCSTEFWTMNLELYSNFKVLAVLVSNNKDLNHVYELSGERYLESAIPTRMVSQFVGIGIEEAINMGENVYITLGCFDDVSGIDYPSIICLIDTSVIGKYVYLDGEYQRQNIYKNEHPIWMKDGFEGMWKKLYMWLDIDVNINGISSWRWVIGNDYNSKHGIIAACGLDNNDINHPAECDGHWYINGKLENNITTSDTICELGDNYVCVESADGGLFDIYFDGQYRQIHSGVPLWFLEDGLLDAYLTIGTVSWPPLFDNTYVFAFALNQTQMFAFCPIGQELPNKDVLLNPQHCNKNWYKLELDPVDATKGFIWVEDYVFDIDECKHKDISTTRPPNNINEYPQILCMNDINNGYSKYQSHYGIYLLDTKQTYNGKYIYYNQRLSNTNNEWYLLWNDAKDSWIIQQIIPNNDIGMVRDKFGICRNKEEVFSPDLCNQCWEFANANGNYELNCNVKVTIMENSEESSCMTLPINHLPNGYVSSVILGFDDGVTDMDNNLYSGIWRLSQHATYNDRAYWYKYYNQLPTIDNNYNDYHIEIEYYMFYDSTHRYWIINNILGNINNIKLYCLNWREFEPFKCDIWYTNTIGLTMKMDSTYELPIISTTSSSTSTQLPDTTILHDVTQVKHIHHKKEFNIMPWIIISIGFVTLCGGMVLLFCFCKKKRKKKFMFRDVSRDGIFKTVYGMSSHSADEQDIINIVQMENVHNSTNNTNTIYNTHRRTKKSNFNKGKGEIIAMESDDDDDVISHQIIDENEGTGTIKNEPKTWVKFNQ